jgi:septum site-determining protein MinC
MRENVVFKGSRDGLQLVFNKAVDFVEILQQLETKLAVAADFFTTGTIVQVPCASRLLTPEQQIQLSVLFAGYGLAWQETVLPKPQEVADDFTENKDCEDDQRLVIARTLRGGQEVVHNGSVVIFGDVNPGAEVIAGGDIIIHGACRGVAHAGAYGNTEATITANTLVASQLRIAGMIARAPDDLDKPEYKETARIKSGIVIIEPANR